jgi:hypothetical protein
MSRGTKRQRETCLTLPGGHASFFWQRWLTAGEASMTRVLSVLAAAMLAFATYVKSFSSLIGSSRMRMPVA